MNIISKNYLFNKFNKFILLIVILKFFGYVIYITGVMNDPIYAVYDRNPNIVGISYATILFELLFIASYYWILIKKELLHIAIYAQYISAFLIAFLQWFELYFGSTIDYSNRDKQCFWFPFSSFLLLSFILWNVKFANNSKKDLLIKTVAIAILNIALILLYLSVYESWGL